MADYDLKRIATLLTEGFSPDDLRRLCRDEVDFASLTPLLLERSSLAELVNNILDYAQQRFLITDLLAWASEHFVSYPSTRYTYRPNPIFRSFQ